MLEWWPIIPVAAMVAAGLDVVAHHLIQRHRRGERRRLVELLSARREQVLRGGRPYR